MKKQKPKEKAFPYMRLFTWLGQSVLSLSLICSIGLAQISLPDACSTFPSEPYNCANPVDLNGFAGDFREADGTTPASAPLATGAAGNFTISAGSLPSGLSLDDVNGTIGGSVTVSGTFTFTISATDNDGDPVTAEFEIVSHPGSDPACDCSTAEYDIVLVLDQSGSMNSICGNCAGNAKWNLLVDQVEAFLPAMAAAAGLDDNDRFGIVFFHGNAADIYSTGMIDFESLALGTDLSTTPPYQDIFTELEHVGSCTTCPGGATPLGGGLQQAIQGLMNDDTRFRSILVFTDGMQNRNPMVANAPDYDLIENDPTRSPADGILGAADLPIDFTAADYDDISVYSIGINATGAFETMLQSLSTATDGDYQYTDDPADDLSAFFDLALTGITSMSSPQIALITAGSSNTGDTLSHEFVVNQGVSRITAKFRIKALQRDDNFAATSKLMMRSRQVQAVPVWLEKNGVRVTAHKHLSTGPQFAIVNLEFPTRDLNNNPLPPAGDWAFKVGFPGQSQIDYDYDLTIFEDEKRMDVKIDLGNKKVYDAGNTIPIKVEVGIDGQPINSNPNFTVRMLRPGEDLGDLLANTQTPTGTQSTEAESTEGQKKLEALMESAEFVQQLEPVGDPVTLTKSAAGTYTASYSNTDLTGSYRLVVIMEGNETGFGKYQRLFSAFTVVDFGPAVESTSEVTIAGQGKGTHLSIKPKNKAGKLLGPDNTHRIFVNVSQGSAGTVQDMLDGTYKIPLSIPEGADPVITVHIIDQTTPVVEGKVSDIKAGRSSDGSFLDNLIKQLEAWGLPSWMIAIIVLIVLFIMWLIARLRKKKSS